MSVRNARPALSASRTRRQPRRWLAACALIALAGLLCLAPQSPPVHGQDRRDRPAADHALPVGPWGRLTARARLLSPPAATVAAMDVPTAALDWVLPDMRRTEMADLLASLNVDAATFAALASAITPAPDIAGYRMQPSAQLVLALPRAARATLYRHLAQHPHNRSQINAHRFWGTSAQAWLAAADLQPATIALVEPLIYTQGHMLCFADIATVWPMIDDTAERHRLLTVLAQERTLELTLHIAHGQDIEPLVDWWGTLGRRDALRATFQRLADQPAGGQVDVTSLLPGFARGHLYRYPDPAATDSRAIQRDCHWSALNFHRDRATDLFADDDTVARMLDEACDPVSEPRFGDLVVYQCGDEVFHTAVYVAADVLFTKNGPRLSRPWMLLPAGAMIDFYPRTGPVQVRYLRLRQVTSAADTSHTEADLYVGTLPGGGGNF